LGPPLEFFQRNGAARIAFGTVFLLGFSAPLFGFLGIAGGFGEMGAGVVDAGAEGVFLAEFPDDDGVGLIEQEAGAGGMAGGDGGVGGLQERGGAGEGTGDGEERREKRFEFAPVGTDDGDVETAGGVFELVPVGGTASLLPGGVGFGGVAAGVEGDAEADVLGGDVGTGGREFGDGPAPERGGGFGEAGEDEIGCQFGAEQGAVFGGAVGRQLPRRAEAMAAAR